MCGRAGLFLRARFAAGGDRADVVAESAARAVAVAVGAAEVGWRTRTVLQTATLVIPAFAHCWPEKIVRGSAGGYTSSLCAIPPGRHSRFLGNDVEEA